MPAYSSLTSVSVATNVEGTDHYPSGSVLVNAQIKKTGTVVDTGVIPSTRQVSSRHLTFFFSFLI